MKRLFRGLFLLCLAVVLLTETALADTGPKPQLTVRVDNAPEELYYLDLLEENGPWTLHRNLNEEELAALDLELLNALRSAVPEGWHACLAQGTVGPPMWGDLTPNEQGLHTFSYLGLPDTYRILMVTKTGEVFLSEVCTRKVLQSSATVDWAAKTVSIPPTWVGYVLQFLSTLLPTLVLEGLLLIVFDLPWKKNWKPFLLVNLITQGTLALYFSVTAVLHGVSWWYFFLFIPAEIVIALVEALLYRRLLTGQSKGCAFAYGIAANLCSAALGLFIMEPVWQFVVSIS